MRRAPILLLTFALILAGCGPARGVEPGPGPVLTPDDTPAPTASAAPPETRVLTICLGQEPDTLFPYDAPNAAARSVLSALYDGPMDYEGYALRPVILQKLPALADGDAVITPVPVRAGSEVVDASGLPVTLDAGVRVRPSGCRADSCAVTYDGQSPLAMDQLVVTFRLRPGLRWSDGTPLTAADSVLGYRAAAASPRAPQYVIERTQTYEAADELTVQWWGKPGFLDPDYAKNFWLPLPAHRLGTIPPAELAASEAAARAPIGWGPYVLEEWSPGQALRFARNPYYFRAAEGLPRFDALVFRIMTDSQEALGELLTGGCDLLDPSVRLDAQVGLLARLAADGQLQAFFVPTATFERLDFGLRPAAYDGGYVPGQDPPALLADRRTRQAIAHCVDRARIVQEVLYGQSVVPAGFLPADHPLAAPGLTVYNYDPVAGRALLEQAGWRDLDGNPATPLEAWDVAGVTRGTLLKLELITTGAAQRRQIAELLRGMLAGCGIQLEVTYLDQAQFYAPGPGGRLFGRDFQLAGLAMSVQDNGFPCEWYTTASIPSAGNFWIGTNLSGFSDAAYDAACARARSSLADESAYWQALTEAQRLLQENLPSLPLFQRLKIAAAQTDLCGLRLHPVLIAPELQSLESLGRGGECGG